MNLPFPSDLEIAQGAKLEPIAAVAARAGIPEERLEPYGKHVAKIELEASSGGTGTGSKYVVVTAVTPTPLGEGKTATSVSLAQGMAARGRNAMLALRQPSMGPTFGIKGGAAGGGYSQVVPMEKLNLHLTGDFHAVTAAHNMLAAILDNHLHFGNELDIDERSITWRRVLDVNDRSLRNIVVGLGERTDGVTRQTGFDITSASEVMVILSLATSLNDLHERLARIVVGLTRSGEPLTARALKADGAMSVILADAIKPNLMQTLEHTPALIHAGPFGNIATGNSSVVADYVGLEHSDYVITEAGFGADMGAERFFNVKCRTSGLRPDAAVLVVTVRALKSHSGRYRIVPGQPLPDGMLAESPEDVAAGAANLRKHIDIVRSFGVSPVAAINAFPTDHESEHEAIRTIAAEEGAEVAVHRGVSQGGAGATDLADAVVRACDQPGHLRFTYGLNDPLTTKIEKVATEVYGADGVDLSPAAAQQLERYERLGFGRLPVVIAKTHLSLSSDPGLKGARQGGDFPCERFASRPVPGTCTPSAEQSGPCPGCRAIPPPNA